jgi:hypothetical protein
MLSLLNKIFQPLVFIFDLLYCFFSRDQNAVAKLGKLGKTLDKSSEIVGGYTFKLSVTLFLILPCLAYIGLLLLDIFPIFLFFFFRNSPLELSYRFNTEIEKVFVIRKPFDCDWDAAPLGAKHCSYKASISKSDDGKIYLNWEKMTE